MTEIGWIIALIVAPIVILAPWAAFAGLWLLHNDEKPDATGSIPWPSE